MFEFDLLAQAPSTRARAGVFRTPHGDLPTPVFAPVGTAATVKALTPAQLRELGATLVLSNTYHLYLRPGDELIRDLGGLHAFMGWDSPILTDSGGFQVFSLSDTRKIDDDGVTFKSHIDGSIQRLTPEKSIAIQENLGADIIMALDECAPPLDREYNETALVRTHAWAERSLRASSRPDQALFGIVQGGVYTELVSGAEDTPDSENGMANLVIDKFVFYSWLHSVARLFGSQTDDIGQDYRSFGLPDGREGNIADMDAYISLPLFAVDADSGVSSVMAFDDIGWHEVLRGYEAGKRIRMVKMQPNPKTRNRLWVDVGGELVYQDFPFKKASPRLDSGILYQHESVVESAIIDMGTASDLPKFIKTLVVTVKNLNTQGMEVELDYQVDEDCHTTNWINAGKLLQSPESSQWLDLQNIKRFCYRLRIITNNASLSPDIEGVIPNGFARTPLKLIWTMRIKSGGIYQIGSKSAANTSKLWTWLMENARLPYSVRMESKYLEADNYNVIVHPARSFPYKPARPGQSEEAYLTLTLEEA